MICSPQKVTTILPKMMLMILLNILVLDLNYHGASCGKIYDGNSRGFFPSSIPLSQSPLVKSRNVHHDEDIVRTTTVEEKRTKKYYYAVRSSPGEVDRGSYGGGSGSDDDEEQEFYGGGGGDGRGRGDLGDDHYYYYYDHNNNEYSGQSTQEQPRLSYHANRKRISVPRIVVTDEYLDDHDESASIKQQERPIKYKETIFQESPTQFSYDADSGGGGSSNRGESSAQLLQAGQELEGAKSGMKNNNYYSQDDRSPQASTKIYQKQQQQQPQPSIYAGSKIPQTPVQSVAQRLPVTVQKSIIEIRENYETSPLQQQQQQPLQSVAYGGGGSIRNVDDYNILSNGPVASPQRDSFDNNNNDVPSVVYQTNYNFKNDCPDQDQRLLSPTARFITRQPSLALPPPVPLVQPQPLPLWYQTYYYQSPTPNFIPPPLPPPPPPPSLPPKQHKGFFNRDLKKFLGGLQFRKKHKNIIRRTTNVQPPPPPSPRPQLPQNFYPSPKLEESLWRPSNRFRFTRSQPNIGSLVEDNNKNNNNNDSFPLSFSIPILSSEFESSSSSKDHHLAIPGYAVLDSDFILLDDFRGTDEDYEAIISKAKNPSIASEGENRDEKKESWTLNSTENNSYYFVQDTVKPIIPVSSLVLLPEISSSDNFDDSKSTEQFDNNKFEINQNYLPTSTPPPPFISTSTLSTLYNVKNELIFNNDNNYNGGTTYASAYENFIPILSFTHDINHEEDGKYHVEFSTGNGIQSKESGYMKRVKENESAGPAHHDDEQTGYGFTSSEEEAGGGLANVKVGSVSWLSPEGVRMSLTWTADETGYHPRWTQTFPYQDDNRRDDGVSSLSSSEKAGDDDDEKLRLLFPSLSEPPLSTAPPPLPPPPSPSPSQGSKGESSAYGSINYEHLSSSSR